MRRLWVALMVGIMAAGFAGAQGDARIGVAEEFETVEGWEANNPKAPGTVEGDGERMIFTDHEGGEVTWGSSVYRTIKGVDLDRYPWMVVKVDEMSRGFAAKLVNRQKGEKVGVLRGLTEPGLIAENIAKSTGWSGVVDLAVGLYASGDGASITVDWLRFVSELTDEERAAMPEQTQVEVVPLSGLHQLAARQGATPEAGEPPYSSERFIYRDPVTHAWVWRMTDHPSIERHEYYDIPAWNADGSLLILMTRRGAGRYWLMDADGDNLRPFPEPADGGPMSRPRWTYADPDRVFTFRSDEESTTVLTMDVHDGSVEEVVSIPVGGLTMEPPHPDDQHFLFHRAREEFWIVDAESGEFTHTKLWPTHRRRFTKAPDISLFLNRNQDPETPDIKRRTSWTCTREGEDLVMLTDGEGGHPDWSPDGEMLGYYGSGGIWVINRDGTGKRLLVSTSGGHGGFSLCGEWHVSDAPNSGPYRQQLFVTHLETGRVHRIAFHHSSYSGWGSGVPDPEATHPAPIGSPDSTKICYDSDMMGQPDMWVAVWQYPDRPVNLEAERDGNAVSLTWERPERSKELAGYNVYRRDSFDGEWEQTAEMLQEPAFTDAEAGGGEWDYGVTCREHSDLESRMAIAWGGDRAVTDIEAEALELPEGAEIVLDQRCGDGWYVRAGEEIALDLDGQAVEAAYVWARVRDPQEAGGGWSVARGETTSTGAKPLGDWQWLRTDEAVRGEGALTLTLDAALEVDQVIVTDDAGLEPVGVVGTKATAPSAPQSVSVEGATAIDITLSWEPVEGAEYYRAYATREEQMERGNATLVGTPETPAFVDAGLTPGTTYRYQVTAMDAWGNESEPTPLVEAQTQDADWTYHRLGAEGAELEPPMVFVADESAESGGYAHVPDDYSDAKYVEEGRATFTFDVPKAGVYTLWARTMGLDGKSDSFFVALDEGEEEQWHIPRGGEAPQWRWATVSMLAPVRLDAGEHTLHIRSREDGARIDTIIVTDDPFFTPDEAE
ncbi:MAG: hypothetical protein GF393_07975 [Armatimonadia bacterium]|nr:hypothetical protein [Armatimonadia bacterium]